MRLVEFLIFLLEAHARTLQRLAALCGEENLIEMLEASADNHETALDSAVQSQSFNNRIIPLWLSPTSPGANSSAYSELESSVHDLQLPAQLEFHLWTYPYYRSFIESALDLNSRVEGPATSSGANLVDEAMSQATAWVIKLGLPSSIAPQAERAAQSPWLRFRIEVLTRVGRRPLGPVY